MRRIEAVTGVAADALVRDRFEALAAAAEAIGAQSIDALGDRIGALQEELRETKRRLKAGAGTGLPKPAELAAGATEVAAGVHLVAASLPYESMDALKAASKEIRSALGSGVIAIVLDAEVPQLWVTVSDDLVSRGISASDLVRVGAAPLGAKGGGRPQMAQGMGTIRSGAGDALTAIRTHLETQA
jgi:alanyl-tRNA synthetase